MDAGNYHNYVSAGATRMGYNLGYPIQGTVMSAPLPQFTNPGRSDLTARGDLNGSESSSDSEGDPLAPLPAPGNYSIRSRPGYRAGRPDKLRLPAPKMPQFDGTIGEWDNFLFKFTNVCEYYGLDKRGKLQYLKGCLTGKAISFVRTLPPHTCQSYRALTSRLQERFAGIERADVLRRDVQDIKQRIDEAVDEFADRVQTQVSLAYRGFPLEIVNTNATEIFLRGARDRQAAYETAKTHPINIQQALSSVKSHSSLLKAIMGKSALSATRQVSFLEERVTTRHAATGSHRLVTPPPKLTTTAVQTEKSPMTAKSPPRSLQRRTHDRCYNCDEYGHFRAECPKLRDSPKVNGRQ